MDAIDEDCADPEDDELWEAVEDMIGSEEKEKKRREKNLCSDTKIEKLKSETLLS